MPNNRVFYASHGVKVGSNVIKGAQSVGVTTNFNLEQGFQLGQLALYDNIIVDPEVEITITKALDGQPLIFSSATSTGNSIVSTANDRTTVIIGVGDDTAELLSSSAAIECTGMYISSLTYTFPVDGNFTEDVTLVGNHKALSGSVSQVSGTASMARRQQFDTTSTLPTEVQGQNISNITISADLGRESMYKLGQYAPFHRFVNFPLEVTCEFEVIAKSVDGIECDLTTVTCTDNDPEDLPGDETIVIKICDANGGGGYTFNLGGKNKLQSVNYSGGDTGGGNATITYSYSTYNELTIS